MVVRRLLILTGWILLGHQRWAVCSSADGEDTVVPEGGNLNQDSNVKPVPKLGASCVSQDDCQNQYSECRDSKCSCISSFPVEVDNMYCREAVPVNGTCISNFQCSYNGTAALCQAGLCVCRLGYKTFKGNESLTCVATKGQRAHKTVRIKLLCDTEGSRANSPALAPTCIGCCQRWKEFGTRGSKYDPGTSGLEPNTLPTELARIFKSRGEEQMKPYPKETLVDPTMLGVLIGLIVMFIVMCVVLRMFSKARFRDQRTVFNSPRMMKMSLAAKTRDRRASHASVGSRAGSRAGSRNPSIQSGLNLSQKSPTNSRGSRESVTIANSTLKPIDAPLAKDDDSMKVESPKSPKNPDATVTINVTESAIPTAV